MLALPLVLGVGEIVPTCASGIPKVTVFLAVSHLPSEQAFKRWEDRATQRKQRHCRILSALGFGMLEAQRKKNMQNKMETRIL